MTDLKIPVGISDFAKIQNYGYYYVDKTGLISDLLEKETAEVTLITRPRRFGKTMGMSMLANFFDIHTGLPNKGSCEELLNNREILREPTACVIFDLNNLKTVNDTRGHSAGDQLILSFARLLRRVIPEKHFVGRYGGDEFMAVIYHTDRQEVEGILDSLRREADAANRDGNQLPLSYAYGWAISTDYEGCVMQMLLNKADYCMYENKRAYYATHDRRAPRS